MKELGTYLKRTRVSNGVNMAEAAEDLELSVTELENIKTLNVKNFNKFGGLVQIVNNIFGGKEKYNNMINMVETKLYG